MLQKGNINEQAKAVRKVAIGCIIMNYGGLEILDNTKHELKQRIVRLINASQSVQNWFILNQHGNDYFKNFFQNEFNSDRILMLSELLETVWDIPADDLEDITNTIKAHIQE